jgi:excisionase family DNA binding protein
MKRYTTVKKASELLGVSTNTVYKYVKEGKIKSRRIGKGRIKIPYSELEPYISKEVETSSKQVSQQQSDKKKATENLHEAASRQPVENTVDQQTEQVAFQGKQPTVEKTMETTTEEIRSTSMNDGGAETISPGNGDEVIFSLFRSFIILGLAVVYLATDITSGFRIGAIDKDLGELLFKLFPYTLIVTGVIGVVRVFYRERLAHLSAYYHILLALVFGYYSFISLLSKNFGLFVWPVSFLVMVGSHFISGLRNHITQRTFSSEFIKYSLFLALIGGVVVIVYPSFFPITFISEYISASKGIAAFVWFVLYLPFLVYFLTLSGKNSRARIPFFVINAVFVVWIATNLTYKSIWDVAYFSYLTGMVALFAAGWLVFAPRVRVDKLPYMVAAFFWTAASVLFGIFSIKTSHDRIKYDIADQAQHDLSQTAQRVDSFFESQRAVMISASSDSQLPGIISESNQEAAIAKARGIYDRLNVAERVLIYNENGIAVGVYPRNSLAQGTNFSSRKYFQETKETYKGYTSAVFKNILGDSAVMQTEPIFFENKMIGMIGVATTPKDLGYIFENGATNTHYKVSVVDENGVHIYSEDEDKIGEKAGDGFVADQGRQEGESLSYSQQVPAPRWKMVYITNTASVAERASNYNLFVSVLLLANAAVTFTGAAIFASKKMTVKQPVSTFPSTPVSGNVHATSI